MKKELQQVRYSYEHGDPTLPHICDMVSEIPDPEKGIILSYLTANCISASPGIIRDEITPGLVIGCGDLYSDGKYCWNDAFINYVRKYNIPVPDEFRDHIFLLFGESRTVWLFGMSP